MRAVLLALLVTAGCYLAVAEPAIVPQQYIDACVDAEAPIPTCDGYYIWTPGYYAGTVWISGRYGLRPGWRHPTFWGRGGGRSVQIPRGHVHNTRR